jgi:hypothetical protein
MQCGRCLLPCPPATNQPFDTVKVRMHTSTAGAMASPVRCAQLLLRTEGLRGLFKGLVPAMAANAPINAVMFTVEHQAYAWMSTEDSLCASWSQDARRLLAGASRAACGGEGAEEGRARQPPCATCAGVGSITV